ncbi:MAG: hypothetical protein FWD79_05155 [Desulfobulbus sp.]|nr:hypothetical protein [Desulfobulbus sp.]
MQWSLVEERQWSTEDGTMSHPESGRRRIDIISLDVPSRPVSVKKYADEGRAGRLRCPERRGLRFLMPLCKLFILYSLRQETLKKSFPGDAL